MSISGRTVCAQSGREIHLTIDSDLNITVHNSDADPLVFVPLVNFARLKDPSIIDAF